MSRSSPRPWRAVSFVPDPTAPNGRRREVAARTAACTRQGLDEFVRREGRAGHEVDVFEVLGLDGVTSDRRAREPRVMRAPASTCAVPAAEAVELVGLSTVGDNPVGMKAGPRVDIARSNA